MSLANPDVASALPRHLSAGRGGVAAQPLAARAALRAARAYAQQRETFGQTIINLTIGFMLADMATQIEAAPVIPAASLVAR